MYCSVDFSEEFQRWKYMKTQIDDKNQWIRRTPERCRDSFCRGFCQKNQRLRCDLIWYFDTLIFRPFSSPTDVFYLIGEKFDFLDFKNLRVWAEWDARMKCRQKNGHTEVSLQDIWENLEEDTGLNAEEGMRLECETEEKLCYANPYMLQVWKRLQKLGKRMIIVSDMYLPRSCIERILQKTGYTGAERIYISNEYGENKAGGDLFHRVIRDFPVRVLYISVTIHTVIRKWQRRAGWIFCPIRM